MIKYIVLNYQRITTNITAALLVGDVLKVTMKSRVASCLRNR